MKVILRSFVLVILFTVFTFTDIYSQCTVSNIIIQNVTVTASTSGTCSVRFDVSFNIQNNNGNKYIFIHSWTASQYPDYFHCLNGAPGNNGSIHAPKHADLVNAFLNIGLNNDGDVPVVLTTYPPDPTVTLNTVIAVDKKVLADGSADIILQGVTATLPFSCETPTLIISDVWSSQSAFAQNAHCVNCGIEYAAGFIRVVGLANCSNLTFTATLINQTTAAITGTYRVYADVNSDGYFTPGSDTAITASAAFNLSAGVGMQTVLTGPVPLDNRQQDLFLVITQSSGASTVFVLPSTECAPLPVTFRSFNASRVNSSNVILKWETATEINNNGFALQKTNGNNLWQHISFIPSLAAGGNSTSPLVYTYNDFNTSKGITQYRIKQVDLDGRSRYSEIRAVRGDGQKPKTILYPNPTTDGRVNVVFEDAKGIRDVLLTDMNGRTIRQWVAVSGNTIQIDKLVSGIYSLRITNRDTGKQIVERIVVNNNIRDR